MIRKLFLLGRNSLARHIGMSFLFLVQVVCILLGGNVILASVLQQAVLEEPYLSYLQQEGYYLPFTPNSILYGQDNLLEMLHGDFSVFTIKNYCGTLENGSSYKIIVYDDVFWDQYHPVLLQGKWENTKKHQNESWAVVSPNCSNPIINIPNVVSEIQAVGVLGELSYYPDMSKWLLTGSMSENLYSVFDIEREEVILMLMPQSSWEHLGIHDEEHFFTAPYCIAVQNHPFTDSEIQENNEILRTHGNPAILLSTLFERAESAKNENIRKYLPLLIAQIIITLFGLICASLIQSMQDRHINDIYSFCGMSRHQWVEIDLLKNTIILGIAVSITLMLYLWGKNAHIFAQYGLLFGVENVLFTGFMIVLFLLGGTLIPFFFMRKIYSEKRRNNE